MRILNIIKIRKGIRVRSGCNEKEYAEYSKMFSTYSWHPILPPA